MGWNIVSQTTEKVVDTNPGIYLKRAENELTKGRFEAAVKEIDTALKYCDSKEYSHYSFEKIKILFAVNRIQDARGLIEKNIKNFYIDFELQKYKKVLALLSKSNYENDKMVTLLKKHGIPWVLVYDYNVSNCSFEHFEKKAKQYRDDGNYEGALQFCDLALSLSTNNISIFFIKAYCYLMTKNYKEALNYYDKIISIDHYNGEAYNLKAYVYSSLGRHNDAISTFNRLLEIYPRNILYINNKAEELIKLNEFNGAELLLLDAVKIGKEKQYDSNRAKTFFLLGKIYDELGKYRKALSMYKKAKSMSSYFDIPYNEKRNKSITLFKKKVIAMTAFVILLVSSILISQYYLYKSGTLKTKLINVSVTTSAEFVEVGKAMKIKEKHKISPSYGVEPEFSFKSSDESIAMVTNDGTITGLKEGRTTVALMNKDEVIESVNILVKTPKVERLVTESYSIQMDYGTKTNIEATILMNYKEAEKPAMEFSSQNPDIIIVNSNGVVEAVGVGTAYVLIKAGGLEKKVSVTVNGIMEELKLDKQEYKLSIGESETINPIIKMNPAGSPIPKIEYRTDNANIASVDNNGKISGVSAGSTSITLISDIIETVKVTVNDDYVDVEGNIYKISIIDGKKVYKDYNGNQYTGEFIDGLKEGYGTYKDTNGNIYEGEFKDSKFNGQGTFFYNDGAIYIGEFKDGRKNGQGTYTDNVGNVYVGNFVDDDKEGYGIMTFIDGESYEGAFEDDMFKGIGTYTLSNGETIKAIWDGNWYTKID